MDARAGAREQAGACGWRRDGQVWGVQKQNVFGTSWNNLLLPELGTAGSLPVSSFSICSRCQC